MHNFILDSDNKKLTKMHIKKEKAIYVPKPRITELMLKIHLLQSEKIPYRQKLERLGISGKVYRDTVEKMNDINLKYRLLSFHSKL